MTRIALREVEAIADEMRRGLRLAVAMLLSLLLTGCGRDGETLVREESRGELDERGAARVRFVNASDKLGALGFTLERDSVLFREVVEDSSPYETFTAGDVRVALVSASDSSTGDRSPRTDRAATGDTIASRRDRLRDGQRYTAIAMPSDDGQGTVVRLFRDQWSNEPGVAQVRLINAAALSGAFDLELVGTNAAIFEEVEYANATPFRRLSPSVAQRLALRQHANPSRVLAVPNLTRLDAGRAYTILIIGHRHRWHAVAISDEVKTAIGDASTGADEPLRLTAALRLGRTP